MKHIISILLLFVYSIGYSYAQTSPWEKVYNDLPRKDRDEYYENARHFLRNYYDQITAAIENVEIHPFITEELIDREETEAVRYQPEFVPERGKQRILTFSQYLLEASNTFHGKSEGLKFVVSNIEEDKYVHGYNALTNCFVRLNYDLEIRLHGETLLKRPCRMCCLFPEAQYKKRVRLMQIEPLEDGFIASATPEQADNEKAKSEITKPVTENKKGKGTNWPFFIKTFILILAVIVPLTAMAFYLLYGDKFKKRSTTLFMYLQKGMPYFFAALLSGGLHAFAIEPTIDIIRTWGTDDTLWKRIILLYSGFLVYLLFPFAMYSASKYFNWEKIRIIISAYQGNANAQYEFGEEYNGKADKAYHGYYNVQERWIAPNKKCEKNYREKAFKWYAKAAKQGNANAQYELGNCYYNGKGVSQNYTQAIIWYTFAAEQGHTDAKKALERHNTRYVIQKQAFY